MRFVHTADWQVGMKAAHVGEAGARVREVRLEAARRVVKAAEAFSAGFILVAGDTFEDNGVDHVYIQKVADILGSFDGHVYLLPGNHDPLVPGSVWDHPSWQSHANLLVLREPEPVELEGGWLYPCPLLQKYSGKDPTSWIDADTAAGIRIGLAHGSVEGIDPDDHYHPIPRDAAARSGLDYLALGHWHSFTSYETGGAVRMAYSGTHEPTRFGERESGQVLLVEIGGSGEPPSVKPEKTGVLEWLALDEETTLEGDIARIRQKIEALEKPSDMLVLLTVSGIFHFDESDELPRLDEIMESRFLYGRVDSSGLHPAPDDAELLSAVPAGVVREAASRLLELSDPAFSGGRPEPGSPEVASRALLELYALAREVGR